MSENGTYGDYPDLLDTLKRIEEKAREARQGFDKKTIRNGRGAIRYVEEEARDALDRAKEREVAAA